MTTPIYDHPRLYEVAFSFRDLAAEVDCFEKCIRAYALRPVLSVLEIGCGPSPHLEALLKRGYAYTGLDINPAMLAYSAQKAAALQGKATFLQGDMLAFNPEQRFDFAFIALGSLCARSTDEIFSHLRSVARALNPGGLYFLDWCISFAPFIEQEDSWSIEAHDLQVTTHYSEKLVDVAAQQIEEHIRLDVLEGESSLAYSETSLKRVIFPQEFLQIIQQIHEFEFVGWWNCWDLDQPLAGIQDPKQISRPITLLRRR